MARFIKSRRKSHGTMPGSLIFIGNRKMEKSAIHLIIYSREHVSERIIEDISELPDSVPPGSVMWINIYGLQDTGLIGRIGERFSIQALDLEDILNTDQRPKMTGEDRLLTFFLKALEYHDDTSKITGDQVSLVLGENFVVTFQEKRSHYFDPVRERIRNGRGRIRQAGADYLTYVLIDSLVDGYIHCIESLGTTIEEAENEVLHQSGKLILEKIYRFKTNIGFIRKSIYPLKEMMLSLNKTGSFLIHKKTFTYLKDLSDLSSQAMEAVDIYHNMTNDYLNIYHSNVALRTNEVMKVLTIFASVFIPLTFIAGVYGTNFDYLPELHLRYAYFVMWGIMIIIASIMLYYFRRKKWL